MGWRRVVKFGGAKVGVVGWVEAGKGEPDGGCEIGWCQAGWRPHGWADRGG